MPAPAASTDGTKPSIAATPNATAAFIAAAHATTFAFTFPSTTAEPPAMATPRAGRRVRSSDV